MAHVDLPFLPEWRERVVTGEKTTTVRTKKYGETGDTFQVDGLLFTLTGVEGMSLSKARESVYREEGFPSPEAFQAHWVKLHPERGWRPQDTVWVHCFTRI